MDFYAAPEQESIADALSGDYSAPPGNPPDEKQTLPLTDAEKHLALLEKFQVLSQEYVALQSELNQRKILDELTAVAKVLRIPEAVLLYDLPRYVADFVVKDDKVVLRADGRQDVASVLKTLQQDRPHWQPLTIAVGGEPLRPTPDGYQGQPSKEGWFTQSPQY